MRKLLVAIITLAVFEFSAVPVLAYVMESTNYRMQFDSINNAGGIGTSTNYKIEDTVGEIGSGFSSSTSFNLYAGYQQMEGTSATSAVFISLTSPDSVVLLPAIGGLSGGVATGSAQLLVATNNNLGYSLKITASGSPALVSGGNSFADYTTDVGGIPDYDWVINNNASEFGFSVEGDHADNKFLNDGSDCNAGSSNGGDKCWLPFSVSDTIIAGSNSDVLANITTTVKMKAESGTNHVQPAGNYAATLTVTAYVN